MLNRHNIEKEFTLIGGEKVTHQHLAINNAKRAVSISTVESKT